MKKLFNTKFKDIKAVTLIALVITIVTLIVLAGVLISLTLGDNGIFQRAKKAKEDYEAAARDEQEKINDLYGQLQVATDGTITIDTQTLRQIINSENEYHVGDSIDLDNVYPTGFTDYGGSSGFLLMYLGKNIGSDVKSITVTKKAGHDAIKYDGNAEVNVINTITVCYWKENILGIQLDFTKNLSQYNTFAWDVPGLTISFNGDN